MACVKRIGDVNDPIVEHAYETILADCTDPKESPEQFISYMRELLNYNVLGGKKNRLLALVYAYQTMEKSSGLTTENLKNACILGWCVEIIQAALLIADDIMDSSTTRRGKLCWYKRSDVGMKAVNDSSTLCFTVTALLRKRFRNHPCYVHISELISEMSFLTGIGQSIDTAMERNRDFEKFTEDTYSTIVQYKTAYYTFSLPVRLGMYLANITDEDLHAKAERICLDLGYIFQVRDDYIDCYGDCKKTGKIGTDIINGKCSWFVVQALKLVSTEQREYLFQNYGKGKSNGPEEAAIKKLYEDLNLEQTFLDLEQSYFEKIDGDINALKNETGMACDVFYFLSEKMFKRDK